MKQHQNLRDTHNGLGLRLTAALPALVVGALLVCATPLGAASPSGRDRNEQGARGAVTAAGVAAPSTFTVIQDGERVRVSWQAGVGADIIGFDLWREENGLRTKVNRHMIPGPAFLTGEQARRRQWYHVEDTLSSPTSFVQYWLEATDTVGTRTWEGPVARTFGQLVVEAVDRKPLAGQEPVTTSSALGLGTPASTVRSTTGFGAIRPTTLPDRPTHGQLTKQASLAGDPGLKIFVTQEGWYRISRSDMAAAGYDPGADGSQLEIYTSGVAQPIVVADGGDGRFDPNDTIEFYGLGLDIPSTGARTYWLHVGADALRLQTPRYRAGTPMTGPAAFTFERKDRTIYLPSIPDGSQGNFFGPVVTTASATQDLTVDSPDAGFTGNATLEIALQGANINIQDPVGVELNGHPVGTVAVLANSGLQTFQLDVPQSWLVAGTNTLRLTDQNAAYGVTLLVSARLTYRHLLRADDGLLEVALPPSTQVTVGGFPTSTIRAIDVTDATAPAALALKVTPDGAGFAATFTTPRSRPGSTVLVFSDNRVLGPPEMSPNTPSSWSTSGSSLRADLVIVTNAAFAAAVETLKSARDGSGVATVIADVDDIYDEYNFGVRDPQAIRDFLEDSTRWRNAPRFVLLVGDASTDPRNYLGIGSFDFVPTKLVTTTYLKTASDNWFTDFDDDGVEDLPIGRLPVRTAADAATVIQKIATRGTPAGTWANRSLLVSDSRGTYDFPQATANLVPLFPATMTVESLTIGATPTPKETIVGALNSGSLLVNYFGHADLEYWGMNVFNGSDAANLSNGNQLPVMMLIACYNGYFHRPNSRSLAESLMLAPNGGAVAVWAASTLTSAFGETVLNQEVYRQLFGTGSLTIGEAMRNAKLAVSDPDIRKSYILFGDPSMKLR